MARLQILELPEGSSDDRPPFALVVDEVSYPTAEAHQTAEAWWQNLAQQIGARGCIVTDDSIDIPANDPPVGLDEAFKSDVSNWAAETNETLARIVQTIGRHPKKRPSGNQDTASELDSRIAHDA